MIKLLPRVIRSCLACLFLPGLAIAQDAGLPPAEVLEGLYQLTVAGQQGCQVSVQSFGQARSSADSAIGIATGAARASLKIARPPRYTATSDGTRIASDV